MLTEENKGLRLDLKLAISGARDAEMGRADGYLLDAIEALAKAVFGENWRPTYDWEERNR